MRKDQNQDRVNIVIYPNGRQVETKGLIDLRSMQEAVGGVVERIELFHAGRGQHWAWVNEEGLIHGLPWNRVASRALSKLGRNFDIVGPVVFENVTPEIRAAIQSATNR